MMSFILFFFLAPCIILAWAMMGVVIYLLMKRIGFLSNNRFEDEEDTDKAFVLFLWPIIFVALPILLIGKFVHKLYRALLDKFDRK